MFDLLTPGKKISLLASAAVAFMMLTAFIASLTEDPANLDWASWLGYYSVLGYAVILVAVWISIRIKRISPASRLPCLRSAV